MPENALAEQVGTQVSLTGHFDVPVRLEDARPLGLNGSAGFECRVRLPDGTLEEAIISPEEAAAILGAKETPAPRPVDADRLRLLVESARIRLAYAYDRQFAVSLSGIPCGATVQRFETIPLNFQGPHYSAELARSAKCSTIESVSHGAPARPKRLGCLQLCSPLPYCVPKMYVRWESGRMTTSETDFDYSRQRLYSLWQNPRVHGRVYVRLPLCAGGTTLSMRYSETWHLGWDQGKTASTKRPRGVGTRHESCAAKSSGTMRYSTTITSGSLKVAREPYHRWPAA